MKNRIFYIYPIITLLVLISCHNSNTNSNTNLKDSLIKQTNLNLISSRTKVNDVDSVKVDSIIYQKIESLEEVRKLEKVKSTDGNITIMIVQRPDSSFKYYWVQVGVSHPDRFQPIFNFYMTIEDYNILYYDPINDTLITIQDWRKKK